MSYFSPALEQIMKTNRKSMNETKSMIKSMKHEVSIFKTIVDYGGDASVGQILSIQQEDRINKIQNKFEKILLTNVEHSPEENRSNKQMSFMQYKAQPAKARQQQKRSRRKNSQKSMKTSIVVEMPQELRQMKNQIMSLPSVCNSRFTMSKNSINGSRLIDSINRQQSKRYHTQLQQSKPQRQREQRRNYVKSLKDILSKLESPQIQCNSYIMDRHKECRKIVQEQEALESEYKKFESMGSPPQKIIGLKRKLQNFEKVVNGSLDSELAYEINNMDQKRYDLVLKHEEEVRRLNLAKFQEKSKKDKIEECKNSLMENHLSDDLGFKMNRLGKIIYHNKRKTIK